MKKKPERRYSAEWHEQVRAEALAFIAKVKIRDAAARERREQLKQQSTTEKR